MKESNIWRQSFIPKVLSFLFLFIGVILHLPSKQLMNFGTYVGNYINAHTMRAKPAFRACAELPMARVWAFEGLFLSI